MMKYKSMQHFSMILLVVTTIMLSGVPSGASDDDSVEDIIVRAESIMTEIENNTSMKRFIPFDVFSDGLLFVIHARNQAEEKAYNAASYYATMAILKFEIAMVLAEANKYDHDLLLKTIDYYKDKKGTAIRIDKVAALFDASLEKIGSLYRAQFLDKYLFDKKHAIGDNGKLRLNPIVTVLQLFPSSTAVIVSHSAGNDKTDFTKQKSQVVKQYLVSRGIDPDRLESIGMGNREVMETNLGYKKINRIEIVFKGIVY